MNERAASMTIKQSAKLSRWLRRRLAWKNCEQKFTLAECELKLFSLSAFIALLEHAAQCDRKYLVLRAVCLWNIFEAILESRSMEIANRICRHQAAWEKLRQAHNEWENRLNWGSRHVTSDATDDSFVNETEASQVTPLTPAAAASEKRD